MCIYSQMVKDWVDGPNRIPGFPDIDRWKPGWPQPELPKKIDSDLARMMKDVLSRLDEIDKKLGNKDCLVEEQAKKRLIQMLEQRANELKDNPITGIMHVPMQSGTCTDVPGDTYTYATGWPFTGANQS